MKNKIFTLIFLSALVIFSISCSTNDKYVIVLALSKQLHAVLYNDNSESIKTASKTYTQENEIATVSDSVNTKTEETPKIIDEKEEAKIAVNNNDNKKETENKEPEYILEKEELKAKEEIKEVMIIKQDDNEILVTANIISFDFDSYELKEEYNEGIDEIYKYLDKNKNVNLIIEGHSDSSGNSNYNIYLSENRAKSIFDKLVDKGIDRERLRYIGYGSTHSSEYNDKDRKCQFVIINNSKEENEYKIENETDIIKLKK